MNRHRTPILGTIAAVGAIVAAALLVLPAQATPPDKVATTMIGTGRFTKIDATAKTDVNPGTPTEFWKTRIKTKGSSDLHVLQNTIAPGRDLRLAPPPRPQPGDRQVRHGNVLPGQRPDLHAPCGPRPGPASSTRATTCTSPATRAASTW
jgi:hypothetical protein